MSPGSGFTTYEALPPGGSVAHRWSGAGGLLLAGALRSPYDLTPAFYDQYASGLAITGFLAVQLKSAASLAAFKTAVEAVRGVMTRCFSPANRHRRQRSTARSSSRPRPCASRRPRPPRRTPRSRPGIGAADDVGIGRLCETAGARHDQDPAVRGWLRTCVHDRCSGRGGMCAGGGVPVDGVANGLAGTIEPSPGFTVDSLAIGVGCVLVLLVVPLLAAWPAWQAASGASRPCAGSDPRTTCCALRERSRSRFLGAPRHSLRV